MKKIFGILGLLIFVCLVTGLLEPNVFLKSSNLGNLVRRGSLFGILSIGVAFVIISGGIDLSIGSLVAVVGCCLPLFLVQERMSVTSSILGIVAISLGIGLFHGLLVTKLRLQSFIVTLCGLMIYRGVARGITGDRAPGFGNEFRALRYLATGSPFLMTWLIAAAGVSVIIWAILTWRRRETWLPRPLFVIIGLILVLIGIAPLWWSWINPHPIEIDPDTLESWGFWKRSAQEFRAAEAAEAPALLLYWIGLAVTALSLIWLTAKSLTAFRKTALPLVCAIASAFLAVFIYRKAIEAWPDALFAELQIQKTWIVLRLAGGLAIAAAGWAWFLTAGYRAVGRSLRVPLILVLIGAVGCAIGLTPLPELRVPMPFLIMLALGIIAAIFLNNTIWGRYLLALGRNEQAARYSGINTDAMIITAYVICSLLAGLGGMLFVLDVNSVQPSSFGMPYELYAIAAAVLGGCSLRGGEGTIAGVIIGAAVMQALYNAINMLAFPTHIEWAIIGTVLLLGIIADELTKRLTARRKIIT